MDYADALNKALEQIATPAKGTATEWLLSVGPILEKQRREECEEVGHVWKFDTHTGSGYECQKCGEQRAQLW